MRTWFSGIIVAVVMMFSASASDATVFWTDEMEPGSWMGDRDHLNQVLIPTGVMSFDANIKHSGTHSIRLNFPSACQASASSGQQCGGAIGRPHPPTDDAYMRWWFRMSGDPAQGATIATANGKFNAYIPSGTKFVENESVHSPTSTNYARLWWSMGCCSIDGKNFNVAAERVPTPANTRVEYAGFNVPDNQWVCMETRSRMNDIGVANGIAQAWMDGAQILNVTDVLWRNSGTDANAKWMEWETIRQGGTGNIWYDDVATGDTRIGCGSVAPPAPLQAVVRWNPTTDNSGGTGLGGYKLYRCLGGTCQPSSVYQTLNATTTSFTDTVIIPGQTYGFAVSAFDLASPVNESLRSATVYYTVPGTDTTAPAAPASMRIE